MQVYIRPKKISMSSSLAFNLKEGPVRCAKVCDKSWVILKCRAMESEVLYSRVYIWRVPTILRGYGGVYKSLHTKNIVKF